MGFFRQTECPNWVKDFSRFSSQWPRNNLSVPGHMKALLLQAWHFLESGSKHRGVSGTGPFSFYNANTKCLFFLVFNPGFWLWSHLQRTFGRVWYRVGAGDEVPLSLFPFLFSSSFCPWFYFFLQCSQVCLHPGKIRRLFEGHFHILILLSIN